MGEGPCRVPMVPTRGLSTLRGEMPRPLAKEPRSLRYRCSGTPWWPLLLQTFLMPPVGWTQGRTEDFLPQGSPPGDPHGWFADEFGLSAGNLPSSLSAAVFFQFHQFLFVCLFVWNRGPELRFTVILFLVFCLFVCLFGFLGLYP